MSRNESQHSSSASVTPGHWVEGELPANVRVGSNSIITGDYAFKRFRSKHETALAIGADCTLDGVHFAIGEEGKISIGNYCYLTNAVLLCELELRIGNYVVISWNTTLADTDFHPMSPAQRIADAVAFSAGQRAAAPCRCAASDHYRRRRVDRPQCDDSQGRSHRRRSLHRSGITGDARCAAARQNDG